MLKSKTSGSRYTAKKSDMLFCLYPHHVCMQNRLEGYEYCLRHILEDKNSPYKQCNFVSSKNGKRCTNAAPKTEKKDGYCSEHTRKALIWRQKTSRKKRPAESSEGLVEQLDYYRPGTSTAAPENPVSQASKLIDYASDSDSDKELTLVDQAWRGDGDSDADSVDSEYEDPLKHAGVYTSEEVALITRDKLIRLQSLYIDQFKRLQHVLKEKRRKFLLADKIERETIGKGIGKAPDAKERQKIKKLHGLKSYRKRRGAESLLYQQSRERRIAATPDYFTSPPKPPKPPKCVYVERGLHCNMKAVPFSKHCFDHILHDPYQVLYHTCGAAGVGCTKPVFGLDKTACIQHSTLPEYVKRFELKPENVEETQQIDVESHDPMPMELAEALQDGQSLTKVEEGSAPPVDPSRTAQSEVCSANSNPEPVSNGSDVNQQGTQKGRATKKELKEEPIDT